ncbi:radical SAM protein [Candidatus Pacearchaeota archaeon]|nr:radical SAM protein [Candidatus Pacearchaeota archaeon]
MGEIYKLSENYKFRIEYFGGILHDKNKKTNYELNHTGAFILGLCKKGLPLPQILDYIEEYFIASPKNLQIAKVFIENASREGILKKCEKNNKEYKLESIINKMIKTFDENEGYLSSPTDVTLYITSKCNNNCMFCFYSNKFKETLCLNDYSKIVRELAEMDVHSVLLLGGEPLLSQKFFPICKEILECGMCPSVTTNGTILNTNIIQEINKLKEIDIFISLQGSTQYLHNFLVGNNTAYQKVLSNIKQMHNELNKKISIITTVTKYNIDDVENLVHLANSLDVEINFQSLIPTSLAHAELLPKPEQIVSMVNSLEILRKKGFRVFYDHPFIFKIKNISPPMAEAQKMFAGCNAGITSMEIMPNGQVFPCAFLANRTEYSCGKVPEERIADIWHRSSVLKNIRNTKINKKCEGCIYAQLCHEGCKAATYPKEWVSFFCEL